MKIIVANWKMNKTPAESADFIRKLTPFKTSNKVIVCPPFTSLTTVSDAIRGTKILLGAQNVHHEEDGAFTGEISPLMLKSIGCKYVIVGHSERRKYFNEKDELINLKVLAAQRHGICPILCVGETAKERNEGNYLNVVKRQLSLCLSAVKDKNLIVAYEPVWAIGTGRNATVEQASEAHSFIKSCLKRVFKQDTPVLYGGSVSPSTASGFLSQQNIDGVLAGGASLEPETFSKLI